MPNGSSRLSRSPGTCSPPGRCSRQSTGPRATSVDNPPHGIDDPRGYEAWRKQLRDKVLPAGYLSGGNGQPLVAGKAFDHLKFAS
jgi:hypothetical protein